MSLTMVDFCFVEKGYDEWMVFWHLAVVEESLGTTACIILQTRLRLLLILLLLKVKVVVFSFCIFVFLFTRKRDFCLD